MPTSPPTPPPTPAPTPPPTPPPTLPPTPAPTPAPTPPPTYPPTAPPTPPPPSPTPLPWPPSPPNTPPAAPVEEGFYPSFNSKGTGISFYYSRFKDSTFSFQYEDVYGNPITSDLQLAQNQGFSAYDFNYRVSLIQTGSSPDVIDGYVVAPNFATNQKSLSFDFTQEKNAELFGNSSGERYYSLLFNVHNNGADNSVLATIYHLPARISSVTVQDYISSQINGVVNQAVTTWTYTGDGVASGFSITGAQDISYPQSGYQAFINGFEELTGAYVVDSTGQLLNFYEVPTSGATVFIQENSGVSQLLNTPLSGKIDFTVNFDTDSVTNYIVRSLDVYTGAAEGTAGSLSGFSLLKTVNFLENTSSHSFSLYAGEVPINQTVYYQFLPKDDFGTGYIYESGTSGYLYLPPQKLTYTNAIPPTLSYDQRTGSFFTGYSVAADVPSVDGALIFQTGDSGQNLFLVKSGQWKTVLPYEEISGIIDANYLRLVSTPATSTSQGRLGDISFSGDYLYAATGTNLWGRTQLLPF